MNTLGIVIPVRKLPAKPEVKNYPMPTVRLVRVLLPLLALFSGCTAIPTPHGTAQFWGDYESVELRDGPVSFLAKNMRHTATAKAHWQGIGSLGAELAGGMMGLKGGAAAVGVLATAVPPIVNRTTNRPAPRNP